MPKPNIARVGRDPDDDLDDEGNSDDVDGEVIDDLDELGPGGTGSFDQCRPPLIQERSNEMSTRETPAERKAGMKQLEAEASQKAIRDFDAAVEQVKADRGLASRKEAAVAVAKSNPTLHRQYLRATNTGRQQRALLAD